MSEREVLYGYSNPKHRVYALIHNVFSKYFWVFRTQVTHGNWPNNLYTDINLFS